MKQCGSCPISLNCWTNKFFLRGYMCSSCHRIVIKHDEYELCIIMSGDTIKATFCEYWFEKAPSDLMRNIHFVYDPYNRLGYKTVARSMCKECGKE